MSISRVAIGIFSTLLLLAVGAGAVVGQDYPNKAIRIVVGPPGDAPDLVSRLIAPNLSEALKQPVIVENRSGISPAETVAKAIPDGYTLLLDGGSFWIGPLLEKMPYDPVKDFTPITLVTTQPYFLAVHPSVAANSVTELISLAKAKPGALNYGSGSIGSGPQLSAELFKALAGVNIVRIPYSGGGPAVTATIGGEVQLTFGNASSILPHVKTGKLKALALTSAQPSPLFPGMPTVAATVPGYESLSILGIFAPANTPDPVVNRLNQEIVRALNAAEVKKVLSSAGFEIVGNSPKEAAARATANMLKWGKLIKDVGIKSN